MEKILFLCTGNSCRSQIAEGLANSILDSSYNIESAGTEAHGVNPNAIATLKEIGVDISNYKSKSIHLDELNRFDLVITLCGDAKEKCPILNKGVKHIHWDLKDPAKFKGTETEIMSQFRNTRGLISNYIEELKNNLDKGNL